MHELRYIQIRKFLDSKIVLSQWIIQWSHRGCVHFLHFLDNDDRMSSKRRNLSALVFLINLITKVNLIWIHFQVVFDVDKQTKTNSNNKVYHSFLLPHAFNSIRYSNTASHSGPHWCPCERWALFDFSTTWVFLSDSALNRQKYGVARHAEKNPPKLYRHACH